MTKNSHLKKATAIFAAVVLFWVCLYLSGLAAAGLGAGVVIWPERIFLQAVKNPAGVFSLPLPNLAAAGIAAGVLIFVNWFFFAFSAPPGFAFLAGYAFITAGALVNLYSRLVFGYVWDFFNFVFFSAQGSWNLADFFIIAGVLFWVYDFVKISATSIGDGNAKFKNQNGK